MTFLLTAPMIVHPMWLAVCPYKTLFVIGKIKAVVDKSIVNYLQTGPRNFWLWGFGGTDYLMHASTKLQGAQESSVKLIKTPESVPIPLERFSTDVGWAMEC
uniref:Uncharacterized protein n=1 Tax=Phocoena sinus TaxID=42100 RepID=A0A8C9E826_PHOSS